MLVVLAAKRFSSEPDFGLILKYSRIKNQSLSVIFSLCLHLVLVVAGSELLLAEETDL